MKMLFNVKVVTYNRTLRAANLYIVIAKGNLFTRIGRSHFQLLFAKVLFNMCLISNDNTFAFTDLHVKFSLSGLLRVDEFEHLLRLSNNGLILVNSNLNK